MITQLVFALAVADITPFEIEVCRDKKAGDACEAQDGKGHCRTIECVGKYGDPARPCLSCELDAQEHAGDVAPTPKSARCAGVPLDGVTLIALGLAIMLSVRRR